MTRGNSNQAPGPDHGDQIAIRPGICMGYKSLSPPMNPAYKLVMASFMPGMSRFASCSCRLGAILFFAVLAGGVVAAQVDDPVADPAAVVGSGDARFTVLTPQMIRMEWRRDARFEDRASLVFLNRKLPVPPFTASAA